MQTDVEWIFLGSSEVKVIPDCDINHIKLNSINPTLVSHISVSNNELRKIAATILIGNSTWSSESKLSNNAFNITRAYSISNSDETTGYFLIIINKNSCRGNKFLSDSYVKYYLLNSVIPSLSTESEKHRVKEKTLHVVRMTALGLSSAEIADVLHLTSRGVDYHLNIAKQLLKATNKPNLVFEAKSLGWF